MFLFHLLEYLDLEYEIDVEEINERWSHEAEVDVWSQIVIKETSSRSTCSPGHPAPGSTRSGRHRRLPPGGTDWHGIVRESEAFYLRILGPVTSGTRAPTSARW